MISMDSFLSLESLTAADLNGKAVLVREDLNVPVNEQGKITDDTRIREALPTLRHLLDAGARVYVTAHFGRPKGDTLEARSTDALRLKPVAEALEKQLGKVITYAPNAITPKDWLAQHPAPEPGSLVLLENSRFHPGEEKNDTELARAFAEGIDIYVNDAFGAAHRAHASTEGVAHHAPKTIAGLLMQRELRALARVVNDPQMPVVAIIGGSKVSTKIGVIENLLQKVDRLLIGGAMMFTFYKAQGLHVGDSLVEDDFIDVAARLLERSEGKLVLPTDVVIAEHFPKDGDAGVIETVPASAIPEERIGLDIGPETIHYYNNWISESRTLVWNGPMGVFETPPFDKGTRALADAIAKQSVTQAKPEGKTYSVLGGGDTLAALSQSGMDPDAFSHVSTGGGASLEYLEGKALPGIAALKQQAATAGGA